MHGLLTKSTKSPKLVGTCFGHQILGLAMGVPVEQNPLGWEISVSSVQLTPFGEKVFATAPTLRIFQMHRDIVTKLPEYPGIQSLGSSDVCAVQGMYVPGKLMSVQGHPEFTSDIVTEIVETRTATGIFTPELSEDAMRRVKNPHDGIEIGVAYLEFILHG
jgi:GMP synthase-like glutamine amidotransferase